jgi:hypothetical protein
VVPSPIWIPATIRQVARSKLTQFPVEGTQHAPIPEPQIYVAQVELGAADVPPKI